MARKIKVGDVMQLRSERGPEMTVEEIAQQHDKPDVTLVTCVWFDVDEKGCWTGPHRSCFPALALVHSEST